MNLWLARNEHGILHLFSMGRPSKFGGHWCQGWHEEGDFLQLSMISPLEKPYYPNVKWEDKEPLEVSLIPTQALREAKKLHVNLTCALHKLHFFQHHDKIEGTKQALGELEVEIAHVLQYLRGLTDHLANGERGSKD